MLAAAAGTSQPVVAALFGLGASALAGAVVAMAWSVHARQIRLAELLVRRQFILTREPAAPEESLNGYAGLEADRLQETLEAVGAREAQAGQTREAQTREAQAGKLGRHRPGRPRRARKVTEAPVATPTTEAARPGEPRRPGPGSWSSRARIASSSASRSATVSGLPPSGRW